MIKSTTFIPWGCPLIVLLSVSPVSAQWLPAVEVKVELADGEPYGGSLDPLFIDRAGLLWLDRIDEGVGRYDGEVMTVYGAENGISCSVSTITQDGQGYIWLGGTRKGGGTTTLLRSTLPFPGGEEPAEVRFTDSLPGIPLLQRSVDIMKTDPHGQVWVSFPGMLVRYGYTDSGQLQADTILTSIRPDQFAGFGFGPDNELLIVQGDSTLYSSTINHRVGEAFVRSPLTGNVLDVGDIIVGPKNFWVKSAAHLVRYALPAGRLGDNPLVGKNLNRLVEGKSSLLFIDDTTVVLSVPNALVEIDKETMAIRHEYDVATDLKIPATQSVLDDGRGNFWMGTVTGLARMPRDFRAYASPNERTMGPEAEISDNVTVMVARMGGPSGKWLFIGTSIGFFIRSESGEWQAVGKEHGLLLPTILGMASDENGRIWAASNAKGINLLSPPEFVHPQSVRPTALSIFNQDYISSGISSDLLFSPFILPLPRQDGQSPSLSLWGGNVLNGQVLTDDFPWLWLPKSTGYQGNSIAFYAQNKSNHVLAASQGGTLLRSTKPFTYDYYSKQLIQNTKTLREGKFYSSLDSNVFQSIELKWDTTTFPIVYGMTAIEDELWLGVETGALVLDLESLETKAFLPMSCESCQPKDFAYDPQRNRIWAASSFGIWEIEASKHRLLRMITEESGLRGNTGFSPQCITLDPEGTIYYATSKGLAAYRPELARPLADSFSVYVREQQFQEDNWGKNEVVLSFAALDFREEKKVYQTKLEGYDNDWSETTTNANLRYTNLPAYLFPKTYRFRVRSLTDDGGWIENATSAAITVSPPWYFRWWAALIGVGLLVLGIRQYLRFQLRRQADALALKEAVVIREQRDEIKQKNDQNELLLKEIHHRVKNNLEVVSSLLELQSAGLADSEARDAMLAGQSRVQSMGLLHQKLYQGENLAAIEMKDYFHNLAGSLQETYEAEDRIKINVVMEPLELDVDTAVPLGLIVNELLTNTIKYAFAASGTGAAAGAVEVGLSREGTGYLLHVADNGVGKDFEAPATGTGFGTRLVTLLSRQLGGTLTEVNDGGLRTTLRFNPSA